MGAYEALFPEKGAIFKKLAGQFRKDSATLPSDFVPLEFADRCCQDATERSGKSRIGHFGARAHRGKGYPMRLCDAKNPVELL